MFKRPTYRIPPVRTQAPDDPIARWIAFTGAPELEFGQAWRSDPDPTLAPAAVRLMWSESALLVAASLQDEDIVSTQAKPNDPAFTQGDAFEMFLKPATAKAYVELHVTPGNVHLALRFPAAGGAGEQPLDAFKIDPDCFLSGVKVDRIASCWTVAADVPWSLLELDGRAGVELLASFSRYDYSEGCPDPVVSSTSPHAECDFHRQQEWAKLALAAGR